MKNRTLGKFPAGVCGCFLLLAGCQGTQSSPQAEPKASAEAAAADEAQNVADAVLGKQAQVLARGDLAGNGTTQVLAANRLRSPGYEPGTDANIALISRAVVLQQTDGKWSEVFRCDEQLKNAKGYLTGAPSDPVTGWVLQYTQGANQALEMRFTPASQFRPVGASAGSQTAQARSTTIIVRWNAAAKRYQSYDESRKRYLGENQGSELPESILR